MLQVIGLPGGEQAQQIMQRAKQLAENDTLSSEKRTEAIHLLAIQNPKPFASFLENLIKPEIPLNVQVAALQALSSIPVRGFIIYPGSMDGFDAGDKRNFAEYFYR